MIQQSQFPLFPMIQDPELSLLPADLLEEEHKIAQSPSPSHEPSLLSPTLSRKLSKKSPLDTPKSRKSKSEDVSNPNQKFGHWALEENKRYHWFLEIHNHHFLHKHMRRMDKIFKTMATFVSTREAEQCRSHHQKMEKKYHSIARILINLRKQHYDSQSQEFLLNDLSTNNIEVIDPILQKSVLIELSQHQYLTMERLETIVPRVSQDVVEEEIREEQKEEEKEDIKMEEEDGLKLLPLNPEWNELDIVDELFGEVPPHFNYQMI